MEVITKEEFESRIKPLEQTIARLNKKLSIYERTPLRTFLRPTEVRQYVMDIHPAVLTTWAEAGLIRRKKVGGNVLYERDSILEFMYGEDYPEKYKDRVLTESEESYQAIY